MAGALVVADTDLVIDFLRDRDPGASLVSTWLERRQLMLTAVTAFELRVGTDLPRRRDAIERLLARRTLPLDLAGALYAGEAFVRLRERGLEIGLKDCLQAGICRRFDLPLATRNVRHFGRVEGLRVVGPV